MSNEKFCLKWNDFQENVSGSFRELKEDQDFCDVTLASEGDQQIEAHKVILAASSPFGANNPTQDQENPSISRMNSAWGQIVHIVQ